MDVKLGYAIVGGLAGFIPLGGTMVLVFLEGIMFFHICHKYKVPVLQEGFGFVFAVAAASFIIKLVVEILHGLLGVGQIINAIVAFLVVYGLAHVVENYARGRAEKN